jgi:hypothetical protein
MSDSGENTIDAAAAEPLALSQLLSRVVDDHDGDRLKLWELAARLSDRSWGGLLLIFAAINILPLPPGATTITGIPLVLLSAQMAAGRSTPWFPQRFDQRGVTKGEITKLIAKLLPWERRIERVLKPRLTALTNHRGARAIGIVCLLLSVILWLPIPLGNHAPAITMTLFATALIYRDGLLVMLGALATLASLALVSVTLGAAALAFIFAVQTLLA